jgi:hypothetical protein
MRAARLFGAAETLAQALDVPSSAGPVDERTQRV